MHLVAKYFVEGVSLTSMNSLLKKVKDTMANATGVDDTINLDALNSEIEDIKAGMDADANDDEEEYDVADIIGKGLALVTQV